MPSLSLSLSPNEDVVLDLLIGTSIDSFSRSLALALSSVGETFLLPTELAKRVDLRSSIMSLRVRIT